MSEPASGDSLWPASLMAGHFGHAGPRLQTDGRLVSPQLDSGDSDRRYYIAAFLGVFILFSITYPYRDIRFPSIFLACLGLIGLSGLMLASWMRPQQYWACIAFCVYIPFSGLYPGNFGLSLAGINFTNVLLIPVMFQLFMQPNTQNEPWIRFHVPDIPLLIFCILSSVSLMRGGIEQGTAYATSMATGLKRWLFPFLIYFVFVNLARRDRSVKQMVFAICVNVTAIAILAMKESFDIGVRGTWDRMRVTGVLGQANSTGTFFVYYTLIFLGLFLCNWKKRNYWLLLIPFLICGRALTLTNSRGGMVAFTFAVLATLWFKSKRLFAVGLTAVILGGLFPQYLPDTISGRLSTTLRPQPEEGLVVYESVEERFDRSAAGRIAIWSAGVRMVKDRPWFGFGYGEFPRKVGLYDQEWHGRDPHNTYLGIAVEMGLIALFFFVLTLLLLLRTCLYVYKRSPEPYMRSLGLAGVGMMMGVIFANFFGSRLDTTELTAYLWILAAILVHHARELRLAEIALRGPRGGRIVVEPWKQAGGIS